MIPTVRLDDRVSTAGQMHVADIPALAAAGFRVLVNNRPDGESLIGQTPSRKISAAAGAAGLSSHYLPVDLRRVAAQDVRDLHAILEQSDGPVLTFCKSGFRCALLWAAHETAYAGQPLDAVMRRAAAAGHDLSGQRTLIERLLADLRAPA